LPRGPIALRVDNRSLRRVLRVLRPLDIGRAERRRPRRCQHFMCPRLLRGSRRRRPRVSRGARWRVERSLYAWCLPREVQGDAC
jgi:hypothetical protein